MKGDIIYSLVSARLFALSLWRVLIVIRFDSRALQPHTYMHYYYIHIAFVLSVTNMNETRYHKITRKQTFLNYNKAWTCWACRVCMAET